MLSIGIVGLPNVGKSTLFKALTKNPVDISNYPFCTIDPNVGVVKVPDERVDKLAKLFSSKKTIHTVVEFHDIAGLVKNASKGEGLGNAFLSHIRRVDAVCEVVRCFTTGDIVHVEGSVDPMRDMEIIHLELILSDLDIALKALEKARSDAKSGKPEAQKRFTVAERIAKVLEDGKMLSTSVWNDDETAFLKELSPLTLKPILVAFNLSEEEIAASEYDKTVTEQSAAFHKAFPTLAAVPVFIASRFELDMAELSPEEASEYRSAYSVSAAYKGLDDLIAKAYETLDLITFLTTGEDETRAWTVKRGSTAPQAGGRIHSDFEQRFIRAEVIPWQTLFDDGSYAKARELGHIRTVGKEYIVQDGDVIEIKI